MPSEDQLAVQNTFHVSMFCIEPQYGPLSDQFLQFAFQTWPDLEYCALTVAVTAPESPLLRYCSPVASQYSNNGHMLYLANRYAFHGIVDVVRAEEKHEEQIYKLTRTMWNVKDFVECVKAGIECHEEPRPFETMLAMMNNQVIGAFVLEYCTAEKSRALLDQFDIEYFCDTKWTRLEGKYSVARYLIVNPLFEIHTRYACREIMRQLALNCIVLPRNTQMVDLATSRIALRELVPVRPRRMIEYVDNLRDGVQLPDSIPGNLQIITMPLIQESRMVVHTPIVVVGGSDTAVSFLESLVYVSVPV